MNLWLQEMKCSGVLEVGWNICVCRTRIQSGEESCCFSRIMIPCETLRLAPNRLRKNASWKFFKDAPTCKDLQVLNYQFSNLTLSFFFFFKETQMQEDVSFKDTSTRCVQAWWHTYTLLSSGLYTCSWKTHFIPVICVLQCPYDFLARGSEVL